MEQAEKIPHRGAPDWDSIGGIDPDFRISRFRAVANGQNTFRGICGNCLAETPHCVNTACCLICAPSSAREHRNGDNPVRAAARRMKRSTYAGVCEDCGPHLHHTRVGRCASCFTSAGVRRKAAPMPAKRRMAKDAGDRTYMGACRLHGRTTHNTVRGLCLECYTALGKPRDELYMKFCEICAAPTVHARHTRRCIECE